MSALGDLLRSRLKAPAPAPDREPQPENAPDLEPAKIEAANIDVEPAKKVMSFDLETELITVHNNTPYLICGSYADGTPGSERILDRNDIIAWFEKAIQDRSIHLVGANTSFDLAVMVNERESLRPFVFQALEDGRISDIAIREALCDIARGDLHKDPKTGRPLGDDDGLRYSLALLTDRHLGLDITAGKSGPDAYRLRYAELRDVPLSQWPQAAIDYPLSDARHTVDVYFAQEKAAEHLVNRGNLDGEAHRMKVAWSLYSMSVTGLHVDAVKLKALREEIELEAAALKELKLTEGLVRLEKASAEDVANGKAEAYAPKTKRITKAMAAAGQEADFYQTDAKGKQVGYYYDHDEQVPLKYVKDTATLQARVAKAYEAMGANVPTTKQGVATDRDTLVQSGDPALVKLGRGGRVDKYKSTYLPKLELGLTGVIHPFFNYIVATGRCSGDTQQLPKKSGIRSCFIPPPGFVFCDADYASLEALCIAQISLWEVGYSELAIALNTKKDMHTMLAASIMGTTYDELLPQVKAKDKRAKDFRDLAKIGNYGFIGGLSAPGLAYSARAKDEVSFCQMLGTAKHCGVRKMPVKIRGEEKSVCVECTEVSKLLKHKWLETFPENRERAEIASRITKGGRLVNVKYPVLGWVRGRCGYTNLLNNGMQALGAYASLEAAWRVTNECFNVPSSPLFGSRPVLSLHDQIYTYIREDDNMHDAATRMGTVMVEALQETVPDLAAACEAEPTLARFMSKDAYTVRDASGKLLVWEPKS